MSDLMERRGLFQVPTEAIAYSSHEGRWFAVKVPARVKKKRCWWLLFNADACSVVIKASLADCRKHVKRIDGRTIRIRTGRIS